MNDSCSYDVNKTLNDQSLYEKAFNTNPDLAKNSIDPGSCKKSNKTLSTETNSSSSTTVIAVTDFGGGGGKSKSNSSSTSQYNATSSQGCASVAAQYATNLSVQNGLSCAVNNTKTDIKSGVSQVEELTIDLENFTTGAITIKSGQGMKATGKS